MPSPIKKLKKKPVKICQQKKSFIACSTPVIENTPKPASTSISAIDTNSSSSNKGQSKWEILQKIATQKRTKKKILQRGRAKQKLKQTEVDGEKEKKRSSKRKKKAIVQDDSNKDWETFDKTLRQSLLNVATSSGSGVLFKDVKSPERIREAPHFTEDPLKSPILRPREGQIDSPERINFGEKEGTLLIKDLPLTRVGFFDSDEEEDTIPLRKEDAVKTYPSRRNEEENKSVIIEKCKAWLVDVSVPTVSSNVLWDNFVKDNYEKVSKYLVPPGNKKQKSLRKRHRKRNDNEDDNKNFELRDGYRGADIFEEAKSKLGPEMVIMKGYRDRSLKKWVRQYDVYNFPDKEKFDQDNEGKRPGLIQYLEKCRTRKGNQSPVEIKSSSSFSSICPLNVEETDQNIRSCSDRKKKRQEKVCEQKGNQGPVEIKSSSSFSSICLLNVEKTDQNLRSCSDRKKKRREKVRENLEIEPKRFKMTMADVSDSELQRINEVRRFASRLNAKKKQAFSNEISLPSTSKNPESDCNTVTTLQKTTKRKTDAKEIECKRQKLSKAKVKPTIKSTEVLTTVQLKKDKQNWRVTKNVSK